jgi:hypothetical protein
LKICERESPGLIKSSYDDNPKAFAQGWRDGWNWGSKQTDFSSDEPAENMEKRLYGDIDNDPGETKAIAFFQAFSIWRNKHHEQQTASAGPAPEASAWNGVPGGHVTEDAIKDDLDDPGSFQVVRSFKPWVASYQGTACWETKVVFRAKNKYAALVEASTMVYLTGGESPKVLGLETDIPVNN